MLMLLAQPLSCKYFYFIPELSIYYFLSTNHVDRSIPARKNSLTLKNPGDDWNLISPLINTAESFIKFMREKRKYLPA